MVRILTVLPALSRLADAAPRLAQDRGVEAAGEAARSEVATTQQMDIVLAGAGQQRRRAPAVPPCGRRAKPSTRSHATAHRAAPPRRLLLRAAQPRGGDHLHRRGDLLGRADAADATPDPSGWASAATAGRSSSGERPRTHLLSPLSRLTGGSRHARRRWLMYGQDMCSITRSAGEAVEEARRGSLSVVSPRSRPVSRIAVEQLGLLRAQLPSIDDSSAPISATATRSR